MAAIATELFGCATKSVLTAANIDWAIEVLLQGILPAFSFSIAIGLASITTVIFREATDAFFATAADVARARLATFGILLSKCGICIENANQQE